MAGERIHAHEKMMRLQQFDKWEHPGERATIALALFYSLYFLIFLFIMMEILDGKITPLPEVVIGGPGRRNTNTKTDADATAFGMVVRAAHGTEVSGLIDPATAIRGMEISTLIDPATAAYFFGFLIHHDGKSPWATKHTQYENRGCRDGFRERQGCGT